MQGNGTHSIHASIFHYPLLLCRIVGSPEHIPKTLENTLHIIILYQYRFSWAALVHFEVRCEKLTIPSHSIPKKGQTSKEIIEKQENGIPDSVRKIDLSGMEMIFRNLVTRRINWREGFFFLAEAGCMKYLSNKVMMLENNADKRYF